ncbi:alpha/beta hydrolase [Pseudovibrio brasiliensis]|uniref:Alpha/beta hydrolase n=1 Tax=Pseudovibrio brasiliensis TaxID=1898042 RepID=A0ABX8AVT8_9HYPH|nr:alpha/beta hydrolase [Pseudovibrio brasiliensis]QUS57386.1 alpha/beta hydrolase [Pseudovibrio brasiliensis]
MLFITNRIPKQGMKSIAGRDFEFDLENNNVANSVFYCKVNKTGRATEVMSGNFLTEVRDSGYEQVLLYCHGFSNMPEDIFKRAMTLQSLFDNKQNKHVLVIPMIWPCDNDKGVVKDYWDDQRAADSSAFAFARVFDRFLTWQGSTESKTNDIPCLMRINILAHSMGARVYRGALESWEKNSLKDGVPFLFRNSFLMAADIVNEALEKGKSGELITHASKNVVVYHASDDLALRASKAANLKNGVASRRLGHTGPEDLRKVSKNVFSIDCDEVNSVYDFPKGHSYFASDKEGEEGGEVFKHMLQCITAGRVFPDDPNKKTHILQQP